MAKSSRSSTLRAVVRFTWIVVAVGLIVALFQPAVNPPTKRERPQSWRNLRELALSIANYESNVGSYPPASMSRKSGQPPYSWRVAVLPYLEQLHLQEEYHFDQPWDSPENSRVAERMPSAFRDSGDQKSARTDTSYVMITGEGTVGNKPNEGVRVHDITDGTSNTILLVEIANSGIAWTEPRDITVDELLARVNKAGFSRHEGGFYAAFCDGTVHFIHTPIDPETLRRLVVRNDGKPIDLDKL